MADKKKSKLIKVIAIIGSIVLVLAIITSIYLGNYYHAVNVEQYLTSTDEITITNDNGVYYFDGPSEDCALIFYPGAKVESTAYAPLMFYLAQNGIDCFLVTMPFNLAMFGADKAASIVDNYNYEHLYIGGHSLGGYVASNYTYSNQDDFEGLILVSSFVLDDFSDSDLRVFSIYGSNDEVLNMSNLNKSHELMPQDFSEFIIPGGNHAYMGSYGEQKGDGKATISHEEQWEYAVEAITNFIIPID